MPKSKKKKLNLSSWDYIFLFILILISNIYLSNSNLHDFWPDEGVMGWEAYEFSNANFNFLEVNLVHPPLIHTVMGILFKLFGVSDSVARVVVPLFAILGIASIYALGTMMFDRKAGAISAFLLATSWVYGFYGVRILTDVVAASATIFAFATFYYAIKARNNFGWTLMTFGTLVALFSKETGWVVPFAYLLYAFFLFLYKSYSKGSFNLKILDDKSISWVKEKGFWLTFAIPALLTLMWAATNLDWVLYEISFFDYGSTVSSIEQNPDPLFYIIHLPVYILLPFPIGSFIYLILFALIIFSIAISFYSGPKKAFLLLVQPLILILIMSNWKFKDYRYILPVYPFFYLFLGSIFYNLKSRFPKIEKYYSLFFVLMLIFAKFSFDNQNAYIMSKRVSYYGYKQASEFLKPLLKVDDLVIASSWSQLRFYLLHPNLRPPPRNETDLCRVLEEENVRYIETDPYEWSQPKYFLPYLYSSVNNLEKICSDKFSVKPIFWVAEPTSEAQGSPVLTVILQVSDAS